MTAVGSSTLSGCSRSEKSPRSNQRARRKSGSSSRPFAIAPASRAPLMPPALDPLMTSTTSSRRKASHSAPYIGGRGSVFAGAFGAEPQRVRRARSSSTAQPPIQTARLMPPLSASATRTSSTQGSTSSTARGSQAANAKTSRAKPAVRGPDVPLARDVPFVRVSAGTQMLTLSQLGPPRLGGQDVHETRGTPLWWVRLSCRRSGRCRHSR